METTPALGDLRSLHTRMDEKAQANLHTSWPYVIAFPAPWPRAFQPSLRTPTNACTAGQPKQEISRPVVPVEVRPGNLAQDRRYLRCRCRELSSRNARKVQSRLRLAPKNQPRYRLRFYHRLWPDRTLQLAGGLRRHGRGRNGANAHYRRT